jgi:hypothetical protein
MVNKHGGARPGAGRKNNPDKKIQISTALAPDVIAILRNGDMPIARHIEMAVRAMSQQHVYMQKLGKD